MVLCHFLHYISLTDISPSNIAQTNDISHIVKFPLVYTQILGCGVSLVVNVLAFYSDDLSLYPAEVYSFNFAQIRHAQ